MWSVLAAGVLDRAYEQLLATGVMGAICLVLGFVIYKLYHAKELQVDQFRADIQALHGAYHAELKGLTEQMMELLKENSASEAKIADVLQQVTSVQSDVERTLDRFMERHGAGGERGRR